MSLQLRPKPPQQASYPDHESSYPKSHLEASGSSLVIRSWLNTAWIVNAQCCPTGSGLHLRRWGTKDRESLKQMSGEQLLQYTFSSLWAGFGEYCQMPIDFGSFGTTTHSW